ncbi:MAG: AMP-binding protein [Gammaproteobacteria bacterium]
MTYAADPRTDAGLVHTYRLAHWAGRTPERTCARFPAHGDEHWTWARADAEASRAAHLLRRLGVGRGDAVALFHEAAPDHLRFMLGALRLGAVAAPVNDAYRGEVLRHALDLCGARVALCSAAFLERIAALELASLRTLVVAGDAPAALVESLRERFEIVPAAAAADMPASAPEVEPIHFWDPYCAVFTSGTTGPSKAALSPYAQIHAVVEHNLLRWLGPDDVYLIDSPMFHVSGLLSLYVMLCTGGQMVFYPKFSSAQYWERVRKHRATAGTIMMLEFLWKQPPRPDDADNTLRWVLTGMLPPYLEDWRARFGVDTVFTFFNMSEISAPLQTGPNPANHRSAGRVRPGAQVRIVDEHDVEVPAGTVGELVVRTDRPWEICIGYLGNPQATADAWRNGWFHTGDAFWRDAEGWYYFVDRLKDSIKRRGENVSSFEVEQAIAAHPAVLECAVVAAPGEIAGDQEVRAVIALHPGATLAAAELTTFLEPRLPRFMLPRYIDFVAALPRNQSTKVLKNALRAQGIGPGTWDRER